MDYAGKETMISKINKTVAEGFIFKTYSKAKHHAALQLRHLKAFFNRLIEWGYVEKNPFKGIKISVPQNHPAFINVDELTSIVDNEAIGNCDRRLGTINAVITVGNCQTT